MSQYCIRLLCFTCLVLSHNTLASATIGVTLDMTEGLPGHNILQGVKQAVNEFNTTDKYKNDPIRIVTKNYRGNPERALDHIKELSNIDGLIGIMGGDFTATNVYLVNEINQKELIYLVPWAKGIKLTDQKIEKPNIFRMGLREDISYDLLLQHAADNNVKKVFLYIEHNRYGDHQRSLIEYYALKHNIQVSNSDYIRSNPKLEDWLDIASRESSDAILIANSTIDATYIVEHLSDKKTRLKKPIYLHLERPLRRHYSLKMVTVQQKLPEEPKTTNIISHNAYVLATNLLKAYTISPTKTYKDIYQQFIQSSPFYTSEIMNEGTYKEHYEIVTYDQ